MTVTYFENFGDQAWNNQTKIYVKYL
jgi:hypothetical protein